MIGWVGEVDLGVRCLSTPLAHIAFSLSSSHVFFYCGSRAQVHHLAEIRVE